jgi:hypothetical protein
MKSNNPEPSIRNRNEKLITQNSKLKTKLGLDLAEEARGTLTDRRVPQPSEKTKEASP